MRATHSRVDKSVAAKMPEGVSTDWNKALLRRFSVPIFHMNYKNGTIPDRILTVVHPR